MNERPLQVSYSLIYFTCDADMTLLSCSWHRWAATASATCVARLGAVADSVDQWPTRLCLYLHTASETTHRVSDQLPHAA